jgi:sporulation integral membrane protein YlbJ
LKILLIITLIVIFSLIYILLKNHDRNAVLTFLCSILVLYIVLNPKQCINFTIGGAKLFFYAVFPSLFPFLVISNLIISFGGIQIYSRLLGSAICKPLGLPKQCSLVLLVSIFCGYPLGARYAAELYEQNFIDHKTFQRLLNIATNGSPLFIIGTVGTTMLGHASFGYILIISNILSCVIMGLVLPDKYRIKVPNIDNKNAKRPQHNKINLGNSLKIALEDATKTCISIGSFVIIFSVLTSIIKGNVYFDTALKYVSSVTTLPIEILQSFTVGMLEVTNGCNIVSASSLSINMKLIVCSFLIAFSGLSITSQVYSLIYKFNVSIKKYTSLKVLQGIISSFITLVLCKLPFISGTKQVFMNNFNSTISDGWFIIFIAFILAVPILLHKIRLLIRIS